MVRVEKDGNLLVADVAASERRRGQAGGVERAFTVIVERGRDAEVTRLILKSSCPWVRKSATCRKSVGTISRICVLRNHFEADS